MSSQERMAMLASMSREGKMVPTGSPFQKFKTSTVGKLSTAKAASMYVYIS